MTREMGNYKAYRFRHGEGLKYIKNKTLWNGLVRAQWAEHMLWMQEVQSKPGIDRSPQLCQEWDISFTECGPKPKQTASWGALNRILQSESTAFFFLSPGAHY